MRLELYYSDDLLDVPENSGFDPLRFHALLTRLKEERGVDFRIVDRSAVSERERIDAYFKLAVPPSVRKGYGIRKVFGTNNSSACFFGTGVPALIVYDDDRPSDVFPHRERGGEVVTILHYLESLLGRQVRGAELARQMDESRRAIGPLGAKTSELVREGRR